MEFLQIITGYLIGLDWKFIITFIIMSYFITDDKRLENLKSGSWLKNFLCKIPKGWRVLFTGLIYAICLFYIRNLHQSDLENLIQSMVFAFVFYELILKVLNASINNWLDKNIPEQRQ